MKRMTIAVLAIGSTFALSQSFMIKPQTFDGGGAVRLTAGSYVMRLSIGQSVAARLTSNTYNAYVGFWTPYIGPRMEESGISYELGQPIIVHVSQNSPNPVSRQTVFNYDISTACRVALSIFDVTGRQVAVLVDEYQSPGKYQVPWDISNVSRGRLANGVYFYYLEAGDFIGTRKLIVCR